MYLLSNLSGLSNLQSFGNVFMGNCTSLRSIDLTGLIKLQSIGDNFMYGCISLRSIDLTGLTKLQSIGNYFIFLQNITIKCTKEQEDMINPIRL